MGNHKTPTQTQKENEIKDARGKGLRTQLRVLEERGEELPKSPSHLQTSTFYSLRQAWAWTCPLSVFSALPARTRRFVTPTYRSTNLISHIHPSLSPLFIYSPMMQLTHRFIMVHGDASASSSTSPGTSLITNATARPKNSN